MKVFNTAVRVETEEGAELTDITEHIKDAIRHLPVSTGIALVSSMHTTCALFVNEYQAALVEDLKGLLERLVPRGGGYRHDDARYSDCERGNAHSHLRTALLGRSVAIPINDGELSLGRFQSIILAEFDGPRPRELTIQVLGE